MASKIDLISQALILIGDNPINSLAGNSRAQTVSVNLYGSIAHAELSKFRWSFARKKAQLSKLVDVPIDGEYDHIYQLPTDLITLIKIEPNINYEVYGDKIYCNYNQSMWCDYIYTAAESEWPHYFASVMKYALALEFAPSIRDSTSSQANIAAQYEDAARRARLADSQQRPPRAIVHRPFIDSRF